MVYYMCTLYCNIYNTVCDIIDVMYTDKPVIKLHAETTDVCWAHLINEGLTVLIEENGSANVTVQFQGTGPAINSPPRIQEFECILLSVTEDNQMNEIFKRPCKITADWGQHVTLYS